MLILNNQELGYNKIFINEKRKKFPSMYNEGEVLLDIQRQMVIQCIIVHYAVTASFKSSKKCDKTKNKDFNL